MSNKKINSLASDIRLMFSSDKQLIKKYTEDPEGFAKAIARKKKSKKENSYCSNCFSDIYCNGIKN